MPCPTGIAPARCVWRGISPSVCRTLACSIWEGQSNWKRVQAGGPAFQPGPIEIELNSAVTSVSSIWKPENIFLYLSFAKFAYTSGHEKASCTRMCKSNDQMFLFFGSSGRKRQNLGVLAKTR
jgi:hypothetical protein